jgi:nicotinate-nucleotide pyrophosphorylase (carboxylating)
MHISASREPLSIFIIMLQKHIIRNIVQSAIEEDVGASDITTTSTLTGEEIGKALALAKSDLVVAGIEVFRETFLFLDPDMKFTGYSKDGDVVDKGGCLAEISGNLSRMLTAERVALNFLQRMSGIATLTRRYVDEVKGTRAKILDTRKTVPGLRYLDKYAVRIGGGYNHRYGLYDGGISQALARVRGRLPHTLKVEIEVKNLQELEEAINSGADVIMLDNMSLKDIRNAVAVTDGRVPLEASGNVTIANVRKIAETGVDFISVGALTHSVVASDISLKIE